LGSSVSRRTLAVLAALVWAIGGVVLTVKGSSLLVEAEALSPGRVWPWLGAALGLLVGGLQARFAFTRSCRRNLDRIAALERPRIWQFYRAGFFVALAIMIATGVTLSRLAHGHYGFLIAVGGVELNVGIALLGSIHVYWQRGAFKPGGPTSGSA
jgi:hypothetical protein